MDSEPTTDLPSAKAGRWRRQLMIRVTGFFVLATVAMCSLWVLSYLEPDVREFFLRNDYCSIVGASGKGEVSLGYATDEGMGLVTFPYWVLVSLTVAFSAFTWVHRDMRISLRTVLLVTTFLAILLGMVVSTMTGLPPLDIDNDL